MSVPGGRAQFQCSATGVQWLVNGTALQDLDTTNIMESFSDIVMAGFLTFVDLPLEYNMTSVACIYTSSTAMMTSNTEYLFIQGEKEFSKMDSAIAINSEKHILYGNCCSGHNVIAIGLLPAVGSLLLAVSNTITLTWTPPFTLDITNIDPDIEGYCVDVVSTTSSATLHSQCEIIVTEFTYPFPPRSWCDEFSFVVTPVNVVGNGTSSLRNYSWQLQRKNSTGG